MKNPIHILISRLRPSYHRERFESSALPIKTINPSGIMRIPTAIASIKRVCVLSMFIILSHIFKDDINLMSYKDIKRLHKKRTI
jgi:hypothetical protein